MSKIFISYSRKNKDTAYEVAQALQVQGYTVWTDVSGIPGGSVWQSEIEDAITHCDVMIVIMSPAAKSSEWVAREILFGLDLKKNLIPLLVEQVQLPLALYSLQPIQYMTKREQGFAQLLAALPRPDANNVDENHVSENKQGGALISGISLLALRKQLIEQDN